VASQWLFTDIYGQQLNLDGTILDQNDFDFWFNPHYLNYTKLLDAFGEMVSMLPGLKRRNSRFQKAHFSDSNRKDIPWTFAKGRWWAYLPGLLSAAHCFGS
jgi:hypothetical protein